LDFGRNQLTGTLPEDFERFVELRHLHLDHNQFVGTIPDTFPSIGSLETITLNHNKLTGEVPAAFDVDSLLGKELLKDE
jgi:hypothetical protein